MNLLAIETSSSECSVALANSCTLLAVAETHISGVHDRQLVTLVQHCLEQANMNATHLDAVAVSAGPGSFTGLRIGVSFAKGLCITGTPRLIAVPTMHAIAAASEEIVNRSGMQHLLAVIPSHRQLAYHQQFSLVDHELTACSDVMLDAHDSVRLLLDDKTLVAGPGARLFDSDSISGISRLSARFLVRAVCNSEKSGTTLWVDPLTFEPMYLQEFKGT